MAPFGRLVRFKDESGSIYYGEAESVENPTKETLTGLSVPIYKGEYPWDDDFKLTGEKRTIKEVRLLLRFE